jgi:hypothetical protein
MRARFATRVFPAVAAAALALAAGAPAATPELQLNLTAGWYLELVTPGGSHVRTSSPPGAVIPPGTYQAIVSSQVGDADDTHHMFHLSGPGQNLQTDLLGGDSPTELFTITLLPSSTYTFGDDRNPSLAQVVFSTSASAPAGAGAAATAGATGSGGTTSNTPTTTNRDAVGSKLSPVRGTLTGGVDTKARATLRLEGRPVRTLRAGRYRVVILDESARGSFVLRTARKGLTLSSTAYVGRRTVTVALTAGRWTFASAGSRATPFVVVRA